MAATQVDNANTTNVIINSTSKSGGKDATAANPPPFTFFEDDNKTFAVNSHKNIIVQNNYYKSGWYTLNVDPTTPTNTSFDTETNQTIALQTTNLLNELLKFVYSTFYFSYSKTWNLELLKTYKFKIAFKAQESAIPNSNEEKFGSDKNTSVSSTGQLSKIRAKYMHKFIMEFIEKNTENSSTSRGTFIFPKEFKALVVFKEQNYSPVTPYNTANKTLLESYKSDVLLGIEPTPASKVIFNKFQSEQRTQLIIGVLPPSALSNNAAKILTARSQSPFLSKAYAETKSATPFNNSFGYGPDQNLARHLLNPNIRITQFPNDKNTKINELPPNLLTRNKWFTLRFGNLQSRSYDLRPENGVDLTELFGTNSGGGSLVSIGTLFFIIKPIAGQIVETYDDTVYYNPAIDSPSVIKPSTTLNTVSALMNGAYAYASNQVIYAKKYTLEFYTYIPQTTGTYAHPLTITQIPNNTPASKGLWAMAHWYMDFGSPGTEYDHPTRRSGEYTNLPWETFIELPPGAPAKNTIPIFGRSAFRSDYSDELFDKI